MKLKNILWIGAALTTLTACNDYLDVDAPSKYDNGYVFGGVNEINTALNGVYAQLLSGDTYGSAYLSTFCLNSDVDFATNSNEQPGTNNFRRFDGTSEAGDLKKTWNAAYQGIEYANNFIRQLEHSPLYTPSNKDFETLQQQMGEAKVMRAMFYHDLMWLWGDVPFSLLPTSQMADKVMPVACRDTINDRLIADLRAIAPKMKFANRLDNGIERISKEMCWAMIARLALTEGGYSLRPDKEHNSYGIMLRPDNYRDYYALVHLYCDSIISSGTHRLTKSYRNVFIGECNYQVDNSDDPIFEIPFAQNSTGSIGYLQGPRCDFNEGSTTGQNVWGKASGAARVSTFYRYSFDPTDERLKYVDNTWYYLYDGTPQVNFSYTMYNNKWSKFWSKGAPLGPTSEGNTGINYPYMRYADVLLMDAEALNELNGGPTDQAKEDLAQVRRRAFQSADQAEKVTAYVNAVSGSKECFLKAVLDERKWEFAGENMRWKDLVRNNLYGVALYYEFLRFMAVAENAGGSSEYEDVLAEHDGRNYIATWPYSVYYRKAANPKNTDTYPNTTLDILELSDSFKDVRPAADPANPWSQADVYGWWDESQGVKNECRYSLYGYIRTDLLGNPVVVNADGQPVSMPAPSADMQPSQLPVVRYILPYPREAIQRSAGAYKNYYGYLN